MHSRLKFSAFIEVGEVCETLAAQSYSQEDPYESMRIPYESMTQAWKPLILLQSFPGPGLLLPFETKLRSPPAGSIPWFLCWVRGCAPQSCAPFYPYIPHCWVIVCLLHWTQRSWRTRVMCLEHGVYTTNTNSLMFNKPPTEGKTRTHQQPSQEIISQTLLQRAQEWETHSKLNYPFPYEDFCHNKRLLLHFEPKHIFL